MSLSTNTKIFFEKVARKNFRLACDVYQILAYGQTISPKERYLIRKALQIAGNCK